MRRDSEQREVYHRIFERTFRTLSPPARAVLNLAAILGERLNQLSMYQLVDLSMAQTLAGMSELEQHRVLRDGGREMEFRNELLRGIRLPERSLPTPPGAARADCRPAPGGGGRRRATSRG